MSQTKIIKPKTENPDNLIEVSTELYNVEDIVKKNVKIYRTGLINITKEKGMKITINLSLFENKQIMTDILLKDLNNHLIWCKKEDPENIYITIENKNKSNVEFYIKFFSF